MRVRRRCCPLVACARPLRLGAFFPNCLFGWLVGWLVGGLAVGCLFACTVAAHACSLFHPHYYDMHRALGQNRTLFVYSWTGRENSEWFVVALTEGRYVCMQYVGTRRSFRHPIKCTKQLLASFIGVHTHTYTDSHTHAYGHAPHTCLPRCTIISLPDPHTRTHTHTHAHTHLAVS